MAANTLNTTTYNTVAANTVNGAVLSASAILAWRQNVKDVVNQHATEIDGKVNASGATKLNLAAATGLTISSGAITINQIFHTVDTEGSASSDDLTTINGGSLGDVLYLRPVNSARDIVIKSGTGNIFTTDGADILLGSSASLVELIKFGASSWVVLSTGWNNANSPATLAALGMQAFWSGTIIKWGLVTGVAHGDKITFPTAFPSACQFAIGVINSTGPTSVGTTGASTTGFTVSFSDSSTGRSVYYFAVGY